MLREAFLEHQRQAVAKAVANEETVVVVGARSSNVQDGIIAHPLLDLWPSEDHGFGVETRNLPKNTGCVLYTRFLSHGTIAHLHKQALIRGVYSIQQVLQTGELKAVLSPLLATQRQKPEPVTGAQVNVRQVKEQRAMPLPQKARPGEVQELVSVYVSKDLRDHAHRGWQLEEAKRLLPIARGLDIGSSVKSIAQAISRWSLSPRPSGRVIEAATIGVAVPPVRLVPTTEADPIAGNIDEAIRLVRESIAALTLVANELERTKSVVKDNGAALSKLRQLKGLLENI